MDKDKLEPVPRGMMDELDYAGDEIQPHELNTILMNTNFSLHTPLIQDWYIHSNEENRSKELKLIKHIWLHDPQFKAKKPKKYVVRSKDIDDRDGEHKYLHIGKDGFDVNEARMLYDDNSAQVLGFNILKLDTKEEAEQWTNPLTEVWEVEG